MEFIKKKNTGNLPCNFFWFLNILFHLEREGDMEVQIGSKIRKKYTKLQQKKNTCFLFFL